MGGISTNMLAANDTQRKQKTAEFRSRFKPVFDRLGVSESAFYPKMLFHSNRKLCIQLFKSELDRKEGFYTIIIDKSYEAENNDYSLYYLKHDPKYAEIYQALETDRWAVLYDNLELVNTQMIMITANLNNNSADLDTDELDISAAEMTLRDYAALMWRKPVSNKKWVNKLISNNFNS